MQEQVRQFGRDITNIRRSYSQNTTKAKEQSVAYTQNPQLVQPYLNDIYKYCRSIDISKSEYFDSQNEINHKMRGILLDWLVDVHNRFTLQQETLFLTIHMIDSYLSKQQIQRNRFQLLGITCLFIASKYCEIYPPQLHYYSEVTDKTYSKSEILQMEGKILTALEFEICITSSNNFYGRYSQFYQMDEKTFNLGQYLLQLILLEHTFMHYPNSLQAVAVLYLVQKIYKKNTDCWPKAIELHSQYSESQIRPVAKEICALLCQQTTSLQAVQRKFATSKFNEVSKIQIQYK